MAKGSCSLVCSIDCEHGITIEFCIPSDQKVWRLERGESPVAIVNLETGEVYTDVPCHCSVYIAPVMKAA